MFYSDLYYSNRQTFSVIEEHEPIPEATNDEINHALNQLKKGKSPGPDNIVSEHLRAGGPALHRWLKVFVKVLRSLGRYHIISTAQKSSLCTKKETPLTVKTTNQLVY